MDSTGFNSSTSYVRFVANELALKHTLLRGPSRISPGTVIPSLFHNRTSGGVRQRQPGSAFLQHPPRVFSEVNVLQNVNVKVKPTPTATLSGSVWLITGKIISERSHKLIVLYTKRRIPSNTQGSSTMCSTSNDVITCEYKRRVAHSYHCEVNCYCCSLIRYTVWYSFTAAICIRNRITCVVTNLEVRFPVFQSGFE
jgi:hypothetical protein